MDGLRVVRGPNWKWANQDGFEGCVGTVFTSAKEDEIDSAKAQLVSLIHGKTNRYFRVP